MKAVVLVFPGSNSDRDIAQTIKLVTGYEATMVWHKDHELPKCDLIVLPGGFSYGDYLRCGALASHTDIIDSVIAKAKEGVPILGVCNGFQILTEAKLLPGALIKNRSLHYICKDVELTVERTDTIFTANYQDKQIIKIPIAHDDGQYYANNDVLQRLEGEGLVAFRYCDELGEVTNEANPNGSVNNIAGIYSKDFKILGMMPHPERLADKYLGGEDGKIIFESLMERI